MAQDLQKAVKEYLRLRRDIACVELRELDLKEELQILRLRLKYLKRRQNEIAAKIAGGVISNLKE